MAQPVRKGELQLILNLDFDVKKSLLVSYLEMLLKGIIETEQEDPKTTKIKLI